MPTGTFRNHVTELARQAAAMGQAAAAPGLAGRPWQLPPAHPTDGTDIQNPDFWTSAMGREDLNVLYGTAFNGDPVSPRGKAMAYKAAVDYMGAYERAAQARYASGLRCRVWAGARRQGHGDMNYGVFGAVQRQLDSWLGAVSVTPTETTSESELSAGG